MKYVYLSIIGLTILVLASCEPDPNSGKGFSLPEGNASAGKITFVEFGCNTCHSIADIKQLPIQNKEFPRVKLGGSTHSIKTYGELVTSIINPSHKILRHYFQGVVKSEDGSSKMQIYNDIMTVTQLVDLVTFLEESYEIDPYNRTAYSRKNKVP